MPAPATVRRFDVPFVHLATFFIKAVLAGIPALILLGVILWFAGALLQSLFPALIKMKILISFPADGLRHSLNLYTRPGESRTA